MNAPYSEGTNSTESRTNRPPVDVRGGVAGGRVCCNGVGVN